MDHLSNTPLPGAGLDMAVLPPIVTANSFDGESEEALALRYGRIKKKAPELSYEFTRDLAFLHQYYRIREDESKAVYNVQRFSGAETEHDRNGHILVVRQGNQCVGGVRLSVKTPRQPLPLPMEINDFRIENHFPELANKESRYGQLASFALLPEFRGGEITHIMFKHLLRKSIALNLDMVFGVAPIMNVRIYRKNCITMGLKNVKIHSDIELPLYPTLEEIKMYMISGVIDKDLRNNQLINNEYIDKNASETV